MRLLKEAGQARFSRITISKKSRLPKGVFESKSLTPKARFRNELGMIKHKDKILFDVCEPVSSSGLLFSAFGGHIFDSCPEDGF